MKYSLKHPVNFTANGDTTSQAVGKHINEFKEIYEDINEIDSIKANESDYAAVSAKLGTLETAHTGTASAAQSALSKSQEALTLSTATDAIAQSALSKAQESLSVTIPIARGGTGATTAASARNALGLGNTTGALPIANGGTGNSSGTISTNQLSGYINASSITGTLTVYNGGTGSYSSSGARSNLEVPWTPNADRWKVFTGSLPSGGGTYAYVVIAIFNGIPYIHTASVANSGANIGAINGALCWRIY